MLQDVHRFQGHGTPGDQIVVGDIVIVHNDERKRGFWNLGRVEELIKGSDGQHRAAIVRVSTGKGKAKIFRRPVRLFPLEVNDRGQPQLTIQMRWRRLQNMNHNPQKKWYALKRSNSLRNCRDTQG